MTTFALAILTHGEPAGAVDHTLTRLAPVIGDVGVDIEHGTGCPSIGEEGDQGLEACTCETVRLIVPWAKAA